MSESPEDAARKKFIGYWPLGPIAILLVSPLLMVAHTFADAAAEEVVRSRAEIYLQQFMTVAFPAAPVVVVGGFFTILCLVYKIARSTWARTTWLRTVFLKWCVLLCLPLLIVLLSAFAMIAGEIVF